MQKLFLDQKLSVQVTEDISEACVNFFSKGIDFGKLTINRIQASNDFC